MFKELLGGRANKQFLMLSVMQLYKDKQLNKVKYNHFDLNWIKHDASNRLCYARIIVLNSGHIKVLIVFFIKLFEKINQFNNKLHNSDFIRSQFSSFGGLSIRVQEDSTLSVFNNLWKKGKRRETKFYHVNNIFKSNPVTSAAVFQLKCL